MLELFIFLFLSPLIYSKYNSLLKVYYFIKLVVDFMLVRLYLKLTGKVKSFIAMKSIGSWDDLLLFGKDYLQDCLNITTKPLHRIIHVERKQCNEDLDQEDKERETKWKQIEKSMINSQEYDVVIVLTGVNDLKCIFLPFLQDETGSNKHTFKEELKRLLLTISRKRESRSDDEKTKSTLICLPALPTIPQVFHYPPLCWFVQSLLQMMDDEKRSLAQEFPNVLFVESPNKETINESQSQGNDERIIYSFANISSKMKEGIETLMKKYVSKNEVDKDYQETESFYEASENVGLVVSSLVEDKELVALDGVHPSDFGYILWGNFIADHIAQRMLE